jgi:hypothetical protein
MVEKILIATNLTEQSEHIIEQVASLKNVREIILLRTK